MTQPTIHPFFVFLKKIQHFFIDNKTYTSLLFVVLICIIGFGVVAQPQVEGDTYNVVPRDIVQYVTVTGSVRAAKDVTLSFQNTGKVAYVNAKVGNEVKKGSTLATLEAGNIQAALLDAEAVLANRQAVLAQLQQGYRKEEVAIKERALINAKNSLSQTYITLPDTIRQVDSVTTDVVKNKFSQLFLFTGSSYVLSFSSCDQTVQAKVEEIRTSLENRLAQLQEQSISLSPISEEKNIDQAFMLAYTTATETNTLITTLSQVLLNSCSVTNPSLDGFRTNLALAKTSITALFADLSAKRSALVSAKNTYALAEEDMTLVKAGSDPYTIKAQEALVRSAEALVLQAKSNLQKTYIVAPFTGIITSVDITEGESVNQNTKAIEMIAADSFEVEAKIPEIDIPKVKNGKEVKVTLDAYGSTITFDATVTQVSPTATTEGTVPVYKAVVTFLQKDDRIKPGMTATVTILSEAKKSVYAVPARYLTVLSPTKGQVIVIRNNKEELVDVELGIRGDDGLLEVKEGLLPYDILLSPKTKVREAQKQTN